jgi:hypothetical protein
MNLGRAVTAEKGSDKALDDMPVFTLSGKLVVETVGFFNDCAAETCRAM